MKQGRGIFLLIPCFLGRGKTASHKMGKKFRWEEEKRGKEKGEGKRKRKMGEIKREKKENRQGKEKAMGRKWNRKQEKTLKFTCFTVYHEE